MLQEPHVNRLTVSSKSAEAYKNEGNNAYKQQNYSEAIALYSKAIGT